MKTKKGKKRDAKRLTDEEKAELEDKRQEKLAQDRDKKENEKYEKYVSELRQQNYRSALLSDALKSIDAMRREYNKRRKRECEVKRWNEFLSCSNLPNVTDMPAMREFIYRWKKEIQDDIDTNLSWVLDVDEKTILSQDYKQKNLSFWKLSNEQPTIGNQYVKRIDQCLFLLNELDLVLLTVSDEALKDIKTELRTQLRNVLDQYTIRVLTNIERDMRRIDARTAKLNFKTRSISISLWTTRPVPQVSIKWMAVGNTEIEFPEVEALILINNEFETDGFSYRAKLMHYDHYSDEAPSYNLNVQKPTIPDLRMANDIEWKKREEIMHGILDQMNNERLKWEQKEKERQDREDDAKKTKGGKKEAPQSKKKKAAHKPKLGPLQVTERTVVDVTEDYLKFENDLVEQERRSMSPDSLNLSENDINLREFRILGGIYAFNYLVRPEQYNQLKSHFLYKLGTQSILEHVTYMAKREIDYIEVRIYLSGKVNWWLAPTVCYWQPWEESEEFLSLSPELQDFHKNYEKYMKKLDQLLFSEPQPKLKEKLVKYLHDFPLNTLPRDIDFQQLIDEYIEPRMPITYKFKVEMDAAKEILRKEALHQKEIEMEKTETNLRRRASFNNEMKQYFEKVRMNIDETLAKMKTDFQEFCVEQRKRLVNLGENELQIERFLKHKTEAHEKQLREVEIDEIAKYHDYVDDQFREKVLVFETADNITVEKIHSRVEKTSPREFFPNRPRQMPLKVIDGNTVYNFDVPNEKDAAGYTTGEIDDSALLSTFLRYLIVLYDKNKPVLKEKPKVVEKVVQNEELDSPSSIVVKPKQTADAGAKTKELTKKVKKTKPAVPKKPAAAKPKPKKTATPESNRSKKGQKLKIPATDEVVEKLPSAEKVVESSRIRVIKARKDKKLHLVPHFPGKWVNSGVNVLNFDFETREIQFQISRFGTFGFALPKYCNFPLTYWETYPNANKKHSVMLKIIAKFAEIKIEINEDGYLIERIEPNFINYEPSKIPMEYRELKVFMQDCGFNIFPDRDAGVYINDISEKHRPMEEHTYYCIAQFTLSHYFRISPFNRKSDRRIGIFEVYEKLDNINLPDKFTEILVTPQKCNIVEVSEKLTKSGETFIDYKMVPEEQEYYPDIFNLLKGNSNELSLRYHNQMKHVHRFHVAKLLCSIRPLSFA